MNPVILTQSFWNTRLNKARAIGLQHQALFYCSFDKWKAIEASHRSILDERIKGDESILDAGCAYGRLLDMLPKTWNGPYLGIDLCSEFIQMAKRDHPKRRFINGDLLAVLPTLDSHSFDLAICISMKPMIINYMGMAYWEHVQKEILRVCDNILFLEYTEDHKGELI